MTTYKVIKEAPWLHIGDVYEKTIDFWYKSDNTNAFSKFKEAEVENNKEWFEEIKEVKSIYELKGREIYYYIWFTNTWVQRIYECIWDANRYMIDARIEIWEAFITKEEAETELQKRKAMATIKKWSHDNDWGYQSKIDEECYEIVRTDDWLIYHRVRNYYTINNQYYSIKDKADNAILELESEYKILFWIKEEKTFTCTQCKETMNKIPQNYNSTFDMCHACAPF